jgi:hypothetical protein
MKAAVTIAIAIALTATSAFAGGEPSYPYPPPPPPYPPVIVTAPPPPPLATLVLGVIGLPFTVLGGIATAITPPAAVCVAPDGALFPCAGPTPWPGYGPWRPYPDPPRPSSGPSGPLHPTDSLTLTVAVAAQ